MKKIFRAKICVPAPLVATSVLTQSKGPGTEAHFWNPPPLPSPGAHAIPPPAKQFSGHHVLYRRPEVHGIRVYHAVVLKAQGREGKQTE